MWILLVAVLVVIVVVVSMYNGLVRLKVQCDNAWADIDVQLKRRYDLIPNLVETVKGYAAHEKGTFEAVVQARNSSMAAQGPAAKAEAEGALAGALRQVFALAEAYPQLRAVESFTQLQNTSIRSKTRCKMRGGITTPWCAISIRASRSSLPT